MKLPVADPDGMDDQSAVKPGGQALADRPGFLIGPGDCAGIPVGAISGENSVLPRQPGRFLYCNA